MQPNGQNTCPSARAQHCINASRMARTPIQVHPRSTVSMPAKWQERPFKRRTRTALHPCQPNGKKTGPGAHAQHCIHASQMVRTRSRAPAHRCIPENLFTCTRPSLHPFPPDGKTLVYVRRATLCTVSLTAKWYCTNTRSSAPAQHCFHASQMVRTPIQVHPRSTVSLTAKWY